MNIKTFEKFNRTREKKRLVIYITKIMIIKLSEDSVTNHYTGQVSRKAAK